MAARTVHGQFEAYVRERRDDVAVESASDALTYGELDDWANGIANELGRRHIRPRAVIGLAGPRSPATTAAVLGVLKAGGGYLYFDASSPEGRHQMIARAAGVELMLAVGETTPRLERCENVPCEPFRSERCDHIRPAISVSAADPALIVYTSGSTGLPKGVVIPHRAVLERIRHGYAPRPGDVHKTSLALGAHISELLVPLAAGVPIRIVTDRVVKDVSDFVETLRQKGTQRIVIIPSQLNVILDGGDAVVEKLRAIDTVVVTGEALTPALVRLFKRRMPWATLVNAYGSSEIGALVAMGEVTDEDRIHVGRPRDGSRIYVLDGQLAPVGTGEVGEICVAAPHLADGYLNDIARTLERFVADPFVPGERMYRTGDLGRFDATGVLEVLGRDDGEVRMMGYRVHVTEIERVLQSAPGVMRAVVFQREDNGQHFVDAYVMKEQMAAVGAADLRQVLLQHLPVYMVPNAIHIVDELPLLPSGKVDRQKLAAASLQPAPAPSATDDATPVKASSNLEAMVLHILRQQLRVKDVESTTDIRDLDGNSLTWMSLALRIEQMTGVTVNMNDLFDHPTASALAQFIHHKTVATT